jgi:Skp family chaperone for outer membrane proteins
VDVGALRADIAAGGYPGRWAIVDRALVLAALDQQQRDIEQMREEREIDMANLTSERERADEALTDASCAISFLGDAKAEIDRLRADLAAAKAAQAQAEQWAQREHRLYGEMFERAQQAEQERDEARKPWVCIGCAEEFPDMNDAPCRGCGGYGWMPSEEQP